MWRSRHGLRIVTNGRGVAVVFGVPTQAATESSMGGDRGGRPRTERRFWAQRWSNRGPPQPLWVAGWGVSAGWSKGRRASGAMRTEGG
jgi:hypothetical protein